MRTIAQVTHPLMRITINLWNDKYQLRYELDRYEQTYKFDADTVSLEDVKSSAERMADEVLKCFVSMRALLLSITPHNSTS
ncbi:MAG: hypothetical protein CMD33_03325 [Flavobacteriales bacterium]|nr:hypothetical protein [Crocinitomicaceae bacterium]MBO74286.1 hypothetical protein [Flavobacteriales bacterium]|tara:strand:+ start:525 stop:767 length:243 start_codon:yes stop_codon:yes gene_type:complete